MSTLLEVKRLVKCFGGLRATDDLSLDVRPGEIHAVIGPNGAGKSTLIGQLFGTLKPDFGSILFDGQEIVHKAEHQRAQLGMARSFQITSIFPEMTVEDNVALAVQALAGHSFRFWTPAREQLALREPARRALEQAGLLERADTRCADMAHGELRQLELAMALVNKPRLMLLDEPMAGMGTEDSLAMVEVLKSLKGQLAILLVEHDMDVVFALADRISVLVYGKIIASGLPEEIKQDPKVREAYLGEEA